MALFVVRHQYGWQWWELITLQFIHPWRACS